MGKLISVLLAVCIAVGSLTASAAATQEEEYVSIKTEPTYYTYEKRENAAENFSKYTWAQKIKISAVNFADALITQGIDALYDMIPAPGLPRSMLVGNENDYNYCCCRYCGSDLIMTYGTLPWNHDTFSRPWKIQCPDCKRLFPSNDFESFYKLGLDEAGHFDVDRARQYHHKLFVCPDGDACTCTVPDADAWSEEWKTFYGYGIAGGYLYNELYSELEYISSNVTINCGAGLRPSESGSTWGVDDGFGYDTGVTNSNGVKEVHTYIAHYVYLAWSDVVENIENLANAYVYTGDEAYGRAGAIMLDRVADIYPDMDVSRYGDSFVVNTPYSRGKIQGQYADCTSAKAFALAYDALYPIYEDSQVIVYLSTKAVKNCLSNDKTTAEKIRANAESGILREIYSAVKAGQIYGNFGTYQSALAAAAVVLDSETETPEMLDWVLQTGEYDSKTGLNTGGNVLTRLVDEVNRNGTGNESSSQYNVYWLSPLLEIAEVLENADGYEGYNLFENPKFRAMFTADIPIVLTEDHHAQIGDSGSTAGTKLFGSTDSYAAGWKRLCDPKLAQYIYLRNGKTTDDLHYGIFDKDPERLADEIEDIISEYGELPNESEMLAGYGFAVLRDGENYADVNTTTAKNTLRDFWMYFGANGGHGHRDALNLGIEAYGLNLAPDLGYPAMTGMDPNRLQWVDATISHNTVIVDEENQADLSAAATPLHFDDAGKVKVMDIEAPEAYSQAETYRRTVVMVEADDGDVSYGVDFFRVTGGSKHTYSFHSQAENAVAEEGLEFAAQVDEYGEYVGTYAGADVQYGEDPDTVNAWFYETMYPRGYTWMQNVRRDTSPENKFSVEFDVEDYNKVTSNTRDIRLRLTQLSDSAPSEVAIVAGHVPQSSSNKNLPSTLDYLLVHREGENLDSLFTTVYEPYADCRYVKDISAVDVTANAETTDSDVVQAVKVEHVSGRIDYIVYSTDNTVTYTIIDGDMSFDFRGFVGVYSVNENGESIYRYINDGDIIGEETCAPSNYTGVITDFTRGLSTENNITVALDPEFSEVDVGSLAGRYIYVENDGEENGAYRITSAAMLADGNVELQVDTTLIRSYIDSSDLEQGYIYNIASGQSFAIPSSHTEDLSPEFNPIAGTLSCAAGSTISVEVSAESPVGSAITYVAKTHPRGSALDISAGALTWKPDASQVGENLIEILAYDEAGRYSSVAFIITVYGSTCGCIGDTTAQPDAGTSGGGGGGCNGGVSGSGSDDATTSSAASVTVSSARARAGETIEVVVSLKNNPGLAGLQLSCKYDSVFELIAIEKGTALENLNFTVSADLAANPVMLPWDGEVDDSSNGDIVELTFKVKDDAEIGEYEIQCTPVSAYDYDLADVEINNICGVVTVVDYIPGDINDDENIDVKDVTVLRRYIAGGYNVTVVDDALDVNRDGSIDVKDVTVLRRYIAGGYGIELK